MEAKRRLSFDQHDERVPTIGGRARPAKRSRATYTTDHHLPSSHTSLPTALDSSASIASSGPDCISPLPNELLIRIISYLSEYELLRISPVSKRFSHVAADSQLWRVHYYRRFILPRAHRIPGFRSRAQRTESKLYYSSQRSIWADGGFGRRGGLVKNGDMRRSQVDIADMVDWKREYKLQHNWSQGQCAIEEVQVHDTHDQDLEAMAQSHEHSSSFTAPQTPSKNTMPLFGTRTLVKVVDGVAITVDWSWGLRAWDLRTRKLRAQISLETEEGLDIQPTAFSVDDQLLSSGSLDLAVGFEDGSFGIWRYNIRTAELSRLLRHDKPCTGKLIAIAYRYPYFFGATPKGFITLYSLGISPADALATANDEDEASTASGASSPHSCTEPGSDSEDVPEQHTQLHPPQILTSLKSQSTRQPIALSIREAASSVVASIAYSFDSWGGWCIGIQDFDIRASPGSRPEVLTSRTAYTLPTTTRRSTSSPSSLSGLASSPLPAPTSAANQADADDDDGPTRLSYSHPYLLATLPDNTLALHICTTTSDTLHISDAVRLWGHTSGISDAEITPRGKAVSVSTRGEELRVWELEGRSAAGRARGGSVEIRPRQQYPQPRTPSKVDRVHTEERGAVEDENNEAQRGTDDKKDWVGFDDEMVIVLKSTPTGKESLVIYDFT